MAMLNNQMVKLFAGHQEKVVMVLPVPASAVISLGTLKSEF